MASMAVTRYLPQEYLEIERKAETKSEYYRGEIFAMAGASRRHGTIVFNCNRLIGNQILGGRCEGFTSDMRVEIRGGAAYYYPDIVIGCGDLQFVDNQGDTLRNPTVVIEVLSPTTAVYDRGLKFVEYRSIPSLQEYVTIAQDAVRVELYVRQSDEVWLLTDLNKQDDTLTLASIGCEIKLADIYRGVTFENA